MQYFGAICSAYLLTALSNFEVSHAFVSVGKIKNFRSNLHLSSADEDQTSVAVDLQALSEQSASEASMSTSSKISGYTQQSPSVTVAPPRLAGWFPFLDSPAYLDGTFGGDVGFDPLGFSAKPGRLFWMREAELTHARLAMLGAAGWPLSELWHKQVNNIFLK